MGRIVRTGMAAVLNANDIDTRRAAPYTPASCSPTRHRSRCRAPIRWHAPSRAGRRAGAAWTAVPGAGCPAGRGGRDRVARYARDRMSDAQRLSHFRPRRSCACRGIGISTWASSKTRPTGRWPLRCRRDAVGQPFGPYRGWAPTGGRIGMICFTADAARALFGIALADIHDRVLDAHACLGNDWHPLLDALSGADRDADALAAIERHLAPRWQALRPATPLSSLRNAGRSWVERLALQAREWRDTHSPRQVERRIKTYSGRSLREWQTLVRTESAFFAARDRYEAGAAFNWATLALDEGFAGKAPEPRGQAHHGVLAERIHATLHRRRIVLDVSAVGVRRRGRHIAPACSIARHAGTAPLACPAKAFQKSNRHSKESPNARDSSTTHRRLAAHAMHAGCPIRDARA